MCGGVFAVVCSAAVSDCNTLQARPVNLHFGRGTKTFVAFCASSPWLQVDGFSSDTSAEFEDLMSSRNLDEMKAEVSLHTVVVVPCSGVLISLCVRSVLLPHPLMRCTLW